MTRQVILVLVFVGLSVAIFWGFGFVVALEASTAGITDPADVQRLGNLGELLNVRYGVPLAIIAGLLGAFVTYSLDRISTRQGETEILEFVEAKASGVFRDFRMIVPFLEQGMVMSNSVETAIEVTLKEYDNDRKPIDETFFKRVDGRIEGELAGFREIAAGSSDQPGILDLVEAIVTNPYSSLIADRGCEVRPRSREMMAFIKEKLIAAGLETRIGLSDADDGLLSTDLYLTGGNIASLASLTTSKELRALWTAAPQRSSTLERLGLSLMSMNVALRPGTIIQGRPAERVFFNLGLPMLLTLIDSFPRRDEAASVFDSLLLKRSQVARHFLERAGPDIRLLMPGSWRNSFDQITDPGRLIFIRFDEGDAAYWTEVSNDIKFEDLKFGVNADV
jgi:hypothetical protein